MALKFLLPENLAQQNGSGPVMALDAARGKALLLTLGITRIVEQESLEVCIWGSGTSGSATSNDKRNWRMLQAFPRKSYCGTYSVLLDLTRFREIRYLRAEWRMSRWGSGEITPLFGFYLSAEEGSLHAVGA
jgi:hypothetical protein